MLAHQQAVDEGRPVDEVERLIAVRYNGMIHDYGLLNVLAQVPSVRDAMTQAALAIKQYLQ